MPAARAITIPNDESDVELTVAGKRLKLTNLDKLFWRDARITNYRDGSARPCSSYRYTIVNYDRRGHRSTGVPTSVVTGGCT